MLAPYALGCSITEMVAAQCRFKVIVGDANNQLMSLEKGDMLHRRGIFYAPDFLVNVGGIISCVREYLERAIGVASARSVVAWAMEKKMAL
jgi:leucine dehydrogenase